MTYSSYVRLLAVVAVLAAGAPDLHAQQGTERDRARAERERHRAEREAARRGWLGISFGQNEDSPRTVVVADVFPGSPAARAGLQRGDTLVRLNRRPVTQDVMRSLNLTPGDTVRIAARRKGRDQEFTLVAARRAPQMASRQVEVRRPERGGGRVIIVDGDTVRFHTDSLMVRADGLHRRLRELIADSLGPQLRMLERSLPEMRIRVDGDSLIFLEGDSLILRGGPGRAYAFDFNLGQRSVAGAEFTPLNAGLSEYFGTREGLLVLRVAPGTPAARAGLESGDVVTAINGDAIRSVAELRRAVARAGRGDGDVRLAIVRKGKARELRLGREGGG